MDNQKLRLRQGATVWRDVEGRILALDVDASIYLEVNESGAQLWPLLAEETTRHALVETLVARFSITTEQAGRDVEAFLALCDDRHLLDTDTA